MLGRKTRDLMPAFTGVLIAFATLSVSRDSLSRFWPQNPRKIVTGEALSNPSLEPVVITDIKVGTSPVNLNIAFDAQDEWIKDISFRLKNHSTKNVTYVGVDLFFFADTTRTEADMAQQFRFGQRPDHPNPGDTAISLQPNQSIDVPISPIQYQSLKKSVETRQPMSSLHKVMIRVYLVCFDDGTKWDLGNFYVPDSSRPSGFRKIEAPPGIIRNY